LGAEAWHRPKETDPRRQSRSKCEYEPGFQAENSTYPQASVFHSIKEVIVRRESNSIPRRQIVPTPRIFPGQRNACRAPAILFSRPLRRAHRLFRNFPAGEYRTIVDLGAHQGSFTDLAVPYFSPERLWLVEADPEYADALKRKYAGNSTIAVVPCAVSNQ